jgi:hypothetical protein
LLSRLSHWPRLGATQTAEECVIKSTLGSSDFTFTLTNSRFGPPPLAANDSRYWLFRRRLGSKKSFNRYPCDVVEFSGGKRQSIPTVFSGGLHGRLAPEKPRPLVSLHQFHFKTEALGRALCCFTD